MEAGNGERERLKKNYPRQTSVKLRGFAHYKLHAADCSLINTVTGCTDCPALMGCEIGLTIRLASQHAYSDCSSIVCRSDER